MKPSLRALLAGVIDYAGMFPPAQLPLEEALRNDAAYRQSPDAWMLGRFVLSATKLAASTTLTPIAVVGRGGATAKEFLANSLQDRDDIALLNRRRQSIGVDGYEVRLCNELLHPNASQELRAALDVMKRGNLPTFYEVDYAGLTSAGNSQRWSDAVAAIVGILAENHQGLKIRCGGATAAAVPSAEAIAGALAACGNVGVPVKFTAGLHHPLPRHDASIGAKTHGFLNVFTAGVLVRARGLNADEVKPLLEEENSRNFCFDDDKLHWKDQYATTEELTAARKQGVISFGSCSFDEPREDLRALGWMD
jgi:hypothetical protein